ncbi:unnamed protein product [Adineta ricciae]|uniref:Uncharacterized protein n=1 Tax=Adineta ricciae TaxID=249248 RepID=A0A815MUF5_ADIRI|nr:unnamed protein product [Adineta ricciae]CAF1510195.1 unnamed protein product [Adineta ricciae]
MSSNKFEIIFKEGRGRYMIANEELSQEDIAFVWKPYVLVPYVTYKDQVCANCMLISMKAKHECRNNCHRAYYCSRYCEEQHWNEYHQYECSFLEKIFQLEKLGYNDEVVNYARLVMRILTRRFKDLSQKSNHMSFDEVWLSSSHAGKFSKEKAKEFECIAKLLTEYILTTLVYEKSNDFIEVFLPASEDTAKVHIDDFDQWFDDRIQSNERNATKVLLEKVFILVCIEEVNALFHITFKLDGYAAPPQTYAMGIYPSAAFVNHSCSPNLARFPVQDDRNDFHVGDVVYFATRSIKPGDEVCYSYLERDTTLSDNSQEIIQNQLKRKQKLKEEFFFDCECIRCRNESNGNSDLSYETLIEQLKCKRLECKGWFIPTMNGKQMICEACQMLR